MMNTRPMMSDGEFSSMLERLGMMIRERLNRGESVEIPCVGTVTRGGFTESDKRIRTVNGRKVITQQREIVSANILGVEAGTTGFCGGDTGHGGRTYIRIENLGGSDLMVYPLRDGGGMVMELGGDTELDTITDALEWIAAVLREQSNNAKWEEPSSSPAPAKMDGGKEYDF